MADKVVAYASGLEGGGVLSVCKHFPGHGDTDVDSHKTLPVLPFTRERLDSVELHPFKEAIRAGLSGMMVGHLQVPVIEPIGGLPSSLSRNIVYDLLTEEFAFKGLIFTDALAMKGVSGNGNVSLQALKAGNDMVLAPRNLKEEIAAVLDAIDKGELTREDIEEKCRKVLTYKYVLGLKKKPFVQLSGLGQRINTPQTRDLIRRLNLAAITVLNNENHVLPLHTNQKETMALLEVGDAGETNALAEQLSKYTSLSRFRLRPGMTEEANQRLRDSLATYKRIIVAVSEQKLSPYQTFFGKFTTEAPVIYAFFTQGKMMLQIQRAVARARQWCWDTALMKMCSGRWRMCSLPKLRRTEDYRPVLENSFRQETVSRLLRKHLCILFRKNMGFLLSPCNELIRSLWTVYVRELIPVVR